MTQTICRECGRKVFPSTKYDLGDLCRVCRVDDVAIETTWLFDVRRVGIDMANQIADATTAAREDR